MLPLDILEQHVLPKLTVSELLLLRTVSSYLKYAVERSGLWRRMYSQQFGVPPVIPREKCLGAFLKRCNARLLRSYVSGSDAVSTFGTDLEQLVPYLGVDWTRHALPKTEPSCFYDMESSYLAEDAAVAGIDDRDVAISYQEHIFAGVHIRKIVMLRGACAVLTMEGAIRVIWDHYTWSDQHLQHPQLFSHVFTPENGGRYVDLQLEDAKQLDKLLARDSHGLLHLWDLADFWNPRIIPTVLDGVVCDKFAWCHFSDAFVYTNSEGMFVKGPVPNIQVQVGSVKDFVCLRSRKGFNIIAIMQDHTVQLVGVEGQGDMHQKTSHRLPQIEELVQNGDRLHSLAAHKSSHLSRKYVWLLTEKGRLIECLFAKKTVARAYEGLEGIISVTAGVDYRDLYAHHWNGTVYWLGNHNCYVATEIKSDNNAFRYIQRSQVFRDEFAGLTALYI